MLLAIFIAGRYYNYILQNLYLRIMIKNKKVSKKLLWNIVIFSSIMTNIYVAFKNWNFKYSWTENHSGLTCDTLVLKFQASNSKPSVLKWMKWTSETTGENTVTLGLFLFYWSVKTIKPELVSFCFFFQAPGLSMHSCTAPCFLQKL